jgi:hypothetical protein
MMKKFNNLKNNSERTIQGLVTLPNEFIYKDMGGKVKPNIVYSIYYSLNKNEVYLTGLKSDLKSREMQKINRSEFTSFKNYKILKNPTPSSYPKHYKKTPTDSDYRIGNIRRSFTRLTNDINAEVFEVSEKDSGNGNPLYLNINFDWTISGLKEDVIRKNEKVMKEQEKILPGISKLLTPLEYWKPKKGSKDDTVKKLKFIENY